MYTSAEIEAALLLHFGEELEYPVLLVGLFDHVDERQEFLDADEDPEKHGDELFYIYFVYNF